MMGDVRQPLTPTEGLLLMNSLIRTEALQEKLIEFKRRCRLGTDLEDLGVVGRPYWTGFMQRHGDCLVTKREELYASNQSDWAKPMYTKEMYDIIYDEYIAAGVAHL
jgi:hypothetical protein